MLFDSRHIFFYQFTDAEFDVVYFCADQLRLIVARTLRNVNTQY